MIIGEGPKKRQTEEVNRRNDKIPTSQGVNTKRLQYVENNTKVHAANQLY